LEREVEAEYRGIESGGSICQSDMGIIIKVRAYGPCNAQQNQQKCDQEAEEIIELGE
jgi:hypothetical protein